MRENLSTQGNLEDWIDASEDALWNIGFDRVERDDQYNQLAADLGEKDYLDIHFLAQENGRLRLELDASTSEILEAFKAAITKIMHNKKSRVSQAPTYHNNDNSYQPDSDENSPYPNNHKADPPSKGRGFLFGRGFPFPPYNGDPRTMPFYGRTWFVWLMLIFLPPFGIFLMYRYKKFKLFPRILLTLLAVFYTLLIWLGFFGVNTGLNAETINKWTQEGQSQITRFMNENKPAGSKTTPSTSPTTTPDTSDNDTTDTTDGNPLENFINSLIPKSSK